MSGWTTSAAIAWLQTILRERLGHAFVLRTQSDSTLAIGLPGDARCVTLPLDPVNFTRADSNLACTWWNAASEGWQTALPGDLPAPGADQLCAPLITPTAQGHHVGYDILGLAYWMLTRQEEVGRTDLDEHGRFPAVVSHAYKHGYLERPVVDEWLYVLGQVMRKTWPGIPLKVHQFSMKVSHDVDRPGRYAFCSLKGLVRAMGGDVLRRRAVSNALRAPWVRLRSRTTLHHADPFNTFSWIMDVSERHGLRSAFYFICGRTSELDANYEPEHPAIRQLMREIHARGHEIGLHPSYGSYRTPEIIMTEAARLRRIAQEEGITQTEWGGRMHYLRWAQPLTLQAWEKADMGYDSTLSYADRPSFRCGTCFEYPAFDPVAQKKLRLRIRPLIVMESTIMAEKYMGLGTGEIAFDKFVQMKNTCRALNGCFTLLWHNSEFEEKIKRDLYLRLFNDFR